MTDSPDPETSVPAEETPAQRQARIRRQKREAKITSNATERLDKITRLSGRTPESSEYIVRHCCRQGLDPEVPTGD